MSVSLDMTRGELFREKKMKFLALLTSLLSLPLFAGVKEDFYNSAVSDAEFLSKHGQFTDMIAEVSSELFKVKGAVSSFKYQATSYAGEHEIIYYIPQNLDLSKPQRLMILLHGGGASTSTYATAANVARSYVSMEKSIADQMGFIVVAPSSQYGWGYVVRVLVNEMLELAKKELNINTNEVMLYGHSMGGMGIVRDSHFMADKFALIMPASAGMVESYHIREYFLTYFNTPFIHVNGTNDHFEEFAILANQVKGKVSVLEQELQKTSKYQLHFHPGSHNPDQSVELRLMKEAFKTPRDLYQKEIYFIFQDLMTLENQWRIPPVTHKLIDTGFWVDALERETVNDKPSTYFGEAKMVGQNITITLQPGVKKIRVYLSSKMLNLNEAVTIEVNGKATTFMPTPTQEESVQIARAKKDPRFEFEDFLDIEI
jgi:predicted esterase